MCTAVFIKNKSALFGRNLDLDYHYSESVVMVPRKFSLEFKNLSAEKEHFAIIGAAFLKNGYPLFYDAVNEHGLSAAGLNFPESAVYFPEKAGFYNVASFELIPWILSSCSNLFETKEKLSKVNVLSTDFEKGLPATPLHWIFADKTGCIVVESVAEGLKIHENPLGVLTNEPPFEKQIESFEHGDFPGRNPKEISSKKRFAKAISVKEKAAEAEDFLPQFFHILSAVERIEQKNDRQKTVYSSCMDLETATYYYRTYENSRLTAVTLKKEDFLGEKIASYPFNFGNDIFYQN